MHILYCVLFFFCSQLAAGSIAITLDDHPMQQEKLFTLEERTQRFIDALKIHGCAAAFFCIGGNCQSTPQINSCTQLSSQGHFIANHSMNHRHLSPLALEEFEEELLAAEQTLSGFSGWKKWFRYPYLDYGNREGNAEKVVMAHKILQQHGYDEGYVTINTFDWHINRRLNEALEAGAKVDYERLKTVYISLIKEWSAAYLDRYDALFGNKVCHTLLLHANDLNALFLADILEMLKADGWQLISADQAIPNNDWLKRKLDNPDLIIPKPPSLNCALIDQRLEGVFTEQPDLFSKIGSRKT